ncbi:DUF805 domain-containing protein [Allorhodopirellula solitaria]|uniref:Polyketide cyclase / dehydrase and lipid transport n=1 Tax=Allorhodopirellula solitaria TaxID=2527987 RepID=A0A5C5YK49_9BACT|nr:DUF805 domain-containing protein [Allorhodopirellula solitaria]TWT75232.1 hypothetical protein CA85_05210 [Allorhodopirellula solitaria]
MDETASDIERQDESVLFHWTRWFWIDGPVSRYEYVVLGFGLALLKYLIELSVFVILTGRFFTPLNFLNPWLNSKAGVLDAYPAVAMGWLLFTLPFVAIAVSMSVRRAADAGWSPWWGLSMLVPIVNFAFMAILSIAPGRDRALDAIADEERAQVSTAFAPPAISDHPNDAFTRRLSEREPDQPAAAMAAIGIGCAVQVIVGLLSVWVFREYGFVLFFTTPIIAGAISGAVYNRHCAFGLGGLFGLIALMNIASFALMLGVGLDGAICLLMAFPLLWPLSFFGGLAGRAISVARLRYRDERRGMIGTMLLLPLAILLEPFDDHRVLHRVDTTVVINAPADRVWEQVIAFPEITERPAWFFRLGIAAPIRARIDGEGVGACRYCEFTTGPFVEPITVWLPPSPSSKAGRLAFDVAEQPQPMREWTPFSGLHPPHLEDGFVSRRGQFLLEPMPGNRTRLTGTTWYDIDVRPRLYWQAWAAPTIHAIHCRVLDHIKRGCEERSMELIPAVLERSRSETGELSNAR